MSEHQTVVVKSEGHGPDAGQKVDQKVDLDEHLISIEDIQARYGVKLDTTKPVNSQGLSAAEAAKRLAENGPNQLSPPKKRHPVVIYIV
eukprot:jgi/Hompol1/4282/HPOL_007105-RA